MYIDVVPNRNSPPAILLRESFWKDGKVRKRTLANLSKLPPHLIDALRRFLKGATPPTSPSMTPLTSSAPCPTAMSPPSSPPCASAASNPSSPAVAPANATWSSP